MVRPCHARCVSGSLRWAVREDERSELVEEEVTRVSMSCHITRRVQDHLALAEIELCGELMIAASASVEERLSPDRIDEVLKVGGKPPGRRGRRIAPRGD